MRFALPKVTYVLRTVSILVGPVPGITISFNTVGEEAAQRQAQKQQHTRQSGHESFVWKVTEKNRRV